MAIDPQSAFDEVAGAVFQLYGERRYAEALGLLRDADLRFPDRGATISFWKACFSSLSGDHAAAVAVLAEGIERGQWWSEGRLRGELDLAPLQGRADFAVVVDAARRARSASPGEPALEVLRPTAEPRGLVVALHGANGTIESVAAQWRHATELGYAVGIPLSSQRVTSDNELRGWDDVDLAAGEVAEARDRLASRFGLDPEEAIFAGFSQGGRRVVDWALSGERPAVRRIVSVASGVDHLRADDLERLPSSAARRGVRAAFVVGAEDWAIESVEPFHDALRAAGVASRLDVVSAVGHDYPPDFGSRLPDILTWLEAGPAWDDDAVR